MQLISKLIKDKPILLGVLYSSEIRAVNKYKDFSSYFEKSFQAELEIISQDQINLTLICDNGERFEYPTLEYNPVRLRNFFTYVKPKTEFTFVHFYKHLENELVAINRYKNAGYVKVSGHILKKEY